MITISPGLRTALIFIDVGSYPAANVLHNPHRRVACSNPREQDNRRL
jgi:hypothetical protein